jgi:hypothetical protein
MAHEVGHGGVGACGRPRLTSDQLCPGQAGGLIAGTFGFLVGWMLGMTIGESMGFWQGKATKMKMKKKLLA